MKGCRTCKFARWQLTPKGYVIEGIAGRCEYTVKWPPIPSVMAFPSSNKCGIWSDYGETCACYEPVKKT